jgi:bifunctional non-homologous end joining protein LigD
MEGIVSKRATSPYRDGKRTDDWQQVKFAKSETFVIGGWRETGGYMHTVSMLQLCRCAAHHQTA